MVALRGAIRALRFALLVLTLGISASTVVFSVVDTVVIRRLPFQSPDRLITIAETTPNGPANAIAPEEFRVWRSLDVFSGLAAVGRTKSLRGSGDAESLDALEVSAELFSVLRARPVLGHVFTRENEVKGHDNVAVIGYGLWQRRFAGDPAIVGRRLTFSQGSVEVLGVMPPTFTYPIGASRPTELWVPYVPEPTSMGRSWSLRSVGRLRDGVPLVEANARLAQSTAEFADEHPLYYQGRRVTAVSLDEALFGHVRLWMLTLLAAVGLLLLVVCLNVAHLMLARSASRAREMAVRAALGATRGQLVRSLLIESLLLSTVATVAGVLLAVWGVAVAKANLPAGIPRAASITIDLRVLLVAIAAAVLTGLLFGLLPALRASRVDLLAALSDGGRSHTQNTVRQRWSAALVVAEVAFAVTILVGTMLLVSSFIRLVTRDLGLDYRHVVAFSGVGPPVGDETPRDRISRGQIWLTDLLERVRAVPGVESAALVSGSVPLSGGTTQTIITVAGYPEPAGGVHNLIEIRLVTPDYFRTMRMSLRHGRFLTMGDGRGAPPVLLLNEVAANRYFASPNALGGRVTIGTTGERAVVGVVEGVRLGGPESDVRPEAYIPFAQTSATGGALVVRTADRAATSATLVRALLISAMPGNQVPEGHRLDADFQRLTADPRFAMTLRSVFGVLAIVIAAIGIYGVMAYVVAQRTQEIGVRMALGATASRVVRLVLSGAAAYMITGLVLGMIGAWMLTGFLRALLFQVSPHDPFVYGVVALTLLAAGLLAAFIPARRAASVDPLVVLRMD